MEQALHIAQYMGENPKAYPLLLSVKAVYESFRQLFTYNYIAWESRKSGRPMPNDMELCKELHLNSPYFLNDIRRRAAAWPNQKVFTILQLSAEYDAKSKGIDDGGASSSELLRELILKIFSL